jgi:hypothetical protein
MTVSVPLVQFIIFVKISWHDKYYMLSSISFAEITLAFESNGPLGRGMGAPRPENDFKQFTGIIIRYSRCFSYSGLDYNENCRMTTKCLPKRQDLKKSTANINFHDVREGKSLVRRWNGHRYNDRGEWAYWSRWWRMLSSISFAEITLAFEDDGPLAHHH